MSGKIWYYVLRQLGWHLNTYFPLDHSPLPDRIKAALYQLDNVP